MEGRIDSDPKRFKKIVAESRSISQVADALGYKRRPNGKLAGGIYKYLRQKIADYNLDTSHMQGQGWAKDKTKFDDPSLKREAIRRAPWSVIFKTGSRAKNCVLLDRLLLEGKRTKKCEICNRTKWLGKPIPLQIHHVNGVNNDNREENLRIVCPNCHACEHK